MSKHKKTFQEKKKRFQGQSRLKSPHLIFLSLAGLCASSHSSVKNIRMGSDKSNQGEAETVGTCERGCAVIVEKKKVKDKPELEIKGRRGALDSTVVSTTLSLEAEECQDQHKGKQVGTSEEHQDPRTGSSSSLALGGLETLETSLSIDLA